MCGDLPPCPSVRSIQSSVEILLCCVRSCDQESSSNDSVEGKCCGDWSVETEVLQEDPVPVPFCPLYILRVPCDRIHGSAV